MELEGLQSKTLIKIIYFGQTFINNKKSANNEINFFTLAVLDLNIKTPIIYIVFLSLYLKMAIYLI